MIINICLKVFPYPQYRTVRRVMCKENVTIGIDSFSTVEDLKKEFQKREGVPVMNQVIVRPLDEDRFSKYGFEYAYFNEDLRNPLLNSSTLEDCKAEEIFLLFVDDDDDGIIFSEEDTQIIDEAEDNHCDIL